MDILDYIEEDNSVETHEDSEYIAPTSEREAREITDTIKNISDGVYLLVAKAHHMRADKVLGYKTWADYCEKEFNMSSSRSYQLINLSETAKKIESVLPEGTEIHLTEAQARDIKKGLDSVINEIKEKTEGLSPEEANAVVKSVIEENRNKQRKEKAEKGENQEESVPEEKPKKSQEKSAKKDDGWDSPNTAEWSPNPSTLTPEQTMTLYNFFNTLGNITELSANQKELVDIIPFERWKEVNNQLDNAIEWLQNFKIEWDKREKK